MHKPLAWAGAFALAVSHVAGARAAGDKDLDEIRAQIRELKTSYEARIQALEQRLKEAEQKARQAQQDAKKANDAAQAVANEPLPPPAPAPAPGGAAGLAAFNPAVSVVLQGTYANLSQDPNKYAIWGFPTSGDVSPGKRGFSLGESELAIFANVDPIFSGTLIASITPENTIGVEEAYGIVNGAPYGIVPKFGRFFSGIGYLNEQHQHVWDFVDAPLAYQVFLGGQYAQDGLQAKWVAPTDQYIELGADIGSGDAFPGTERNRNGIGSAAVYAHTGGDVGDSNNWRAGISYVSTRAEDRAYSQPDIHGNDADLSFTGPSRFAIADFVWKYAPHGDWLGHTLKVQGEYFRRHEWGDVTYNPAGVLGPTAGYSARQSGWYLQGVYQFVPRWRAGLRYDRLSSGGVDYGANGAFLATSGFAPRRATAMVDWTPSEFSRLRLQYARSETVPGITDNEWFVQYVLSIGAHGAHRY
ncbi:MAG TPA: hypothetical protein VFE23_05370 [Usitatibacter sp.]|jgi:hypothetical protein|nr:hypothetical protein [Usitatibacter sp.]